MTLKVVTTTSSGSIMGLITLEKALKNQGIAVTRLDEEAFKKGPLPEGYDIGLLHNTLSVSDAVMRRSVVFALQTVVNKLSNGPKLRERVLNAPPIEFWCNTQSAARKLRQMGFAARAMYRPAPRFKPPVDYTPLPDQKRVLWYYDPPHRFMKAKLPVIKELLEQVDDDIEVLLFPSEDCPVDRPNVRALGKIDMGHWVPRVRGMVRVSDHLDYGRSTFDVLAQGRWVLYADMDEEINYSVPTPQEIPARLRDLLEEEGDAEGRARFARASDFEIATLAPIWAARLRALLEAPAPVAAAPVPVPEPAAKAPAAPLSGDHLKTYDTAFYAAQSDGSFVAATHIVPLLQDLLAVGSVCDVGCGAGTWLKVWEDRGVTDILGLEGGHVEDAFRAAPARLVKVDLAKRATPLVDLTGRRFDLVTSLEVAEHLPYRRAASFVEDLCTLSDTVVFSAAIPGQGGKGHLNEQWQSWWAKHFNDQGYGAQDTIRPRIWGQNAIRYWYRQNLLVFRKGVENDRALAAYNQVHPWAWKKKIKKLEALRAGTKSG
ncbi:class I SAM-dependent methyltransferase [Jannaschia sp.]|nr:class I SAM-dependent methyltransferase [Jannaschia sp.]